MKELPTITGELLDPVEASEHLNAEMDTQFTTVKIDSAERCVSSILPMNNLLTHGESIPPADSTVSCASNLLGPSRSVPSSIPSSPIASPIPSPTPDPLLLNSSKSPGSLSDGTGEQRANGSSPASPMAPPGTATTIPFHQPTVRTSSDVSGISTSALKSEPDLTVQFATTHDEDNESDTKRSYREISDDENAIRRPNLIEDVYGVEKRRHQATKKMKTEHGLEEQPNMTKPPISISGDSGLGKWMKEEEGKSTPSSTAPDVVDLTAGMSGLIFQ
jgi:hypothetical protein